MEFKEIQDLLKLVNKTNLSEVVIEQKEFKIKIRRQADGKEVVYAPAVPQALPAQIQPVQIQPAAVEVPAAPAPAPAPEAPKAKAEEQDSNANLIEFTSPMIGTFYRSPSPEMDVFVKVGDSVSKGQVLCIIEAMKLFNEIESEVEGKIAKIMVEDSQPVEYGQVLFLIDPKG